jgi:hypothetical protein
MGGEKEILQEEPDFVVTRLPNIHFLICVTGKVINKEYEKKLKRFLFRIETPPQFTETPTLSITRIILQFGMLKKLHRKYRKILYNGNNVRVGGVIGNIIVTEDENGIEFQRYFIDVMTVEEAEIEIPTIPESPEL